MEIHIEGLAYSEYPQGAGTYWNLEAEDVRSYRLHGGLPSDTSSREIERPFCLHNGGWALSMDSCGYGIKGSWALAGLIYRICELYIDDVLIDGPTEAELRDQSMEPVNSKETKLGHLISFTEEKRLKVLNFSLPQTKKEVLQFLGLGNYFCDQAPSRAVANL